ncbi:hypothetical protein CC86DRAFT_413033 [Ophiobolus disseminans]|uniref:Heterokaryon incompatibility domain-containing protein n=1 Tax=Ophiobolus disseminans TaxID=1469910 RepID=A0A6A6ZGD9_9PLEO|nr:hypothetical protein CC86DRAFT_413033 [Ophiobolus disseminans]
MFGENTAFEMRRSGTKSLLRRGHLDQGPPPELVPANLDYRSTWKNHFRYGSSLWFKPFEKSNKSMLESAIGDSYSVPYILENENYTGLVRYYTSRHLANSGDVERAFIGIAKRLQLYYPLYQPGFYWGIPAAAMQDGLTWELSTRCAGLQQKYRPDYPSWSWMAWAHPVTWKSFDGNRGWRNRSINDEQTVWKYDAGSFVLCAAKPSEEIASAYIGAIPENFHPEHLLRVNGRAFTLPIKSYNDSSRKLQVDIRPGLTVTAKFKDPNTMFCNLEEDLAAGIPVRKDFLPLYVGRQDVEINSQGMKCLLLHWKGNVAFRAGLVEFSMREGELYQLMKQPARTIFIA